MLAKELVALEPDVILGQATPGTTALQGGRWTGEAVPMTTPENGGKPLDFFLKSLRSWRPCGRRRGKSWPVVREPRRVGALNRKWVYNGKEVDQGIARKAQQEPEGEMEGTETTAEGEAP